MLGIQDANTKFVGDFTNFIIGNNILTTSACVVIAFSTGTMMRSFVGDILIPSVYKFISQNFKIASSAFAPIGKSNLDSFLKEFVSWVFVILMTFVLIEYVVRRTLLKMQPTTPKPASPSPVSTPTQISMEEKNNSTSSMTVTERYSSI
jgi:large-conductance mechanosensitive channel